MTPPVGREEVSACRQRLAARYGSPPDVFCYPFGDDSGEAVVWARQAGFAAAVTTRPGVLAQDGDPFLLPRMPAPACAGVAFDEILFSVHRYRAAARGLLKGGAA